MPRQARLFAFKLKGFTWLVFGIIDGLISLRILLPLIGASP